MWPITFVALAVVVSWPATLARLIAFGLGPCVGHGVLAPLAARRGVDLPHLTVAASYLAGFGLSIVLLGGLWVLGMVFRMD